MERKEPTFSGTSSYSSEAPAASNRPPQQKKTTNKVTPPPVSAVQSSGTNSSSAIVALLLALIALVVAGYSAWVLMQTKQQLGDANSRILELQQALQLTGDESTQSMAGLQANLRKQQGDVAALRKDLKTSEHEIRKLWDTRNVNKKAIAANKKNIDQQQSKLKTLPADVKSLKSKLDTQGKQLSSVKTDAGQALETATLLSGSLEQQQQSVRELVDNNNQIQKSLRNVEKSVGANEEAIRSIDAFRKSTNSELWKLKQQLQPANSSAQ